MDLNSRKCHDQTRQSPGKLVKLKPGFSLGKKIYYFIYIAMNLYCFCVIASLNICRQHAFLHGSTKMDLTQQSFCIVYFRNLLFPPLLILQHKRKYFSVKQSKFCSLQRTSIIQKCTMDQNLIRKISCSSYKYSNCIQYIVQIQQSCNIQQW